MQSASVADRLLRAEGAPELRREQRDGVAPLPAQDGELLVCGVADLLGADLGAADGGLIRFGSV